MLSGPTGNYARHVAQRVRVLVADDHPLYREGVTRAIKARAELELVGEAADGRECLEQVRELKPDVAIIDLAMPVLDGMQVLHALGRDGHSTRALLLSARSGPEAAYEALAQGAKGFLVKGADAREVCDAVLAVARGETVLAPEIQAQLAVGIRERADADGQGDLGLTGREREVLEGIADGLSARQIGARLHLSEATIKTHTSTLYEKLGVSERAAAVAAAMRRGLLE
jgi:two-component system nitrate/nitrite response regulator NarL